MISELYRVMVVAGAPEDKAREAAEALASENLATKADIRNLAAQLNLLR